MSQERGLLGEEKPVSFRELVELPSTTHATFALYRYPAKFIPHVVAYVLREYSEPGMKIFDPFGGYGTVGVVSRLYDCDYEMWDLNPFIETLHKVATLEPKKVNIRDQINLMKRSVDSFHPDWSRVDYWFPDEFMPLLEKVWGYYHNLEDEYLKTLLTIPLLKTTRKYSYDDMGRMKLSKSPKSKERITKLLDIDWETEFYKKLYRATTTVMKKLWEYQELSPKSVKSVVKGGIDTLSSNLEEEKDILVTSPPYIQSQEYIREAKLNLYWLGYPEKKIKKLGKLEIPYRDVDQVQINSETYSTMRERIEEPHILKVFDRYFWAVIGSFTRISEKIRSRMCLFVGRTSLRGEQVPIDTILAEHFTHLGWKHEMTLVDTIVSRSMFSYRVNPATKIKDKRTSVENMVILRRP